MRPIKLVMTAFGPYRDTTTIDFDIFANKLFLIDGATGSGKTFIFDAISFALYGDVSGESRQKGNLRSEGADDSVTSEVVFTFAVNGKEYIIHRTPAQTKAKERGEGTKFCPMAVILKDGDKVYTKTKEAQAKIDSIIGLSHDDFRSTMLIAQGSFDRLIKADTAERKELFRRILGTADLRAFIEELRVRSSEADKVVASKNDEIGILLKQFEFDDEELMKRIEKGEAYESLSGDIAGQFLCDGLTLKSLEEAANASKNQMKEAVEAKTKAESNNKNAESFANHSSNFAELESRKAEMDTIEVALAKSKKAEKFVEAAVAKVDAQSVYAKAEDELKKANASKADIEAKIKEMEPRVASLGKLNAEKDAIQVQIAEKDTAIDNCEKLENKKDCFRRESALLGEMIETLKKLDASIASEEAKLNELEERTKVFDKSALANAKSELEANENEKAKLDQIHSHIKELEVAENNRADIANKAAELAGKEKKANDDYHAAYESFLRSTAGLLAKDLEEGVPCPVCGSVHHVKLAELDENTVDQAKLKKMDEDREAIRKETVDKVEELSNSDAEVKRINGTIAGAIGQSVSNSEEYERILAVKIAANLEKHAELICKVQTETEKAVKNEKGLEAIKISKAILNGDKIKKANFTDKSSNLRQEIGLIQGTIKSLEETTHGMDQESLKAVKADLEASKKKLEDEIAEISASQANAKEALASATSDLVNKENTVKEKKAALLKASDTLDSMKDSGFSSIDEAKTSIIEDAVKVEKELNDFRVAYGALKTQLAEDIKNGYDKLEIVDVEELKAQAEYLTQKNQEDNQRFSDFKATNDRNRKNDGLINETIDSCKDDMKKSEELKKLYQAASGTLPGSAKLDFEAFYQAQMFDKVLKVASAKLKSMSHGRYEFQRATEWNKTGNAQVGLEINVFDYNLGSVRSGKDLSGGESFQASLALATSFSEIVASRHGAIEMNSMFIDEGFGTLDQETLKTTIDVLVELGDQSGKMIGVISHREELKDRIKNRIDVTNDGTKSNVHIIA